MVLTAVQSGSGVQDCRRRKVRGATTGPSSTPRARAIAPGTHWPFPRKNGVKNHRPITHASRPDYLVKYPQLTARR